MKIKRYFAPDMRQAIRQVRDTQGPDAVILSSRNVDGGIELIAAIDYDEGLVTQMADQADREDAPMNDPTMNERLAAEDMLGDDVLALGGRTVAQGSSAPESGSPPPRHAEPAGHPADDSALAAMRKEIQGLRGLVQEQLSVLMHQEFARAEPWRAVIVQRLETMGLDQALARSVAESVDPVQYWAEHLREGLDEPVEGWGATLEHLASRLPIAADGVLDHSGIITLVGPSGVGKTTTVAKLAALSTLRHGQDSVAIITTDAYRLGAHRQLQTIGQLLGVPVYLAQTGQQLSDMLGRVKSRKLVLIDTTGTSQRDRRMLDELADMTSVIATRILLVLAANLQKRVLAETLQAFDRLQPDGCILTKVDEAASLGEVLSALIQSNLPLNFVSEGQRIPEDLRRPQAQRLVQLAAAALDGTDRYHGVRSQRRPTPEQPALQTITRRDRVNESSTRFTHASTQ